MSLRRLMRRTKSPADHLHSTDNIGSVPNAEQSKVQQDQNRSNIMSETGFQAESALPTDPDGFTDPGPQGYPQDPEGADTPAPADEAGPFDGTAVQATETGQVLTDVDDAPAPAEDTPPADDPAPADDTKASRRPRGWLAQDVKTVLDKTITGEIAVEEGKPLTPHRVARLVQEMDGLDKPPSTGAVAAVFERWEEYGFATFSEKPRAFVDYTDEGRNVGLSGLIQARSEHRKAQRAAEKAASSPAPVEDTATAPEGEDAPGQ